MSYPGGKNGAGVYQVIINQIPPHDVFIEPFFGSGAIARRIRPARRTIGVDRDLEVLERSRGLPVELIAGDGIAFLEKFPFTGREFVYCDPPYLLETRRSGPLYRYEMTRTDHHRLLEVIRRLPCPVMISGYFSRLYALELADWRTLTYRAMTRGGSVAEEWLWMNYAEPQELHDYRYLGEDFRERERIKRLIARQRQKFARLEPAVRRAILEAVLPAASPGAPIAAGISSSGDASGHPARVAAAIPAAADPTGAGGDGRPRERMRAGAHRTHQVRTAATAARVSAEIERRRAAGAAVSISAVAASLSLSREHLTRRYRHLFA